jgi:hypothetical protein
MRNTNLKTASYIRQGRGMSLRAIEAYNYGAKPVSKWAVELGIKTDDVREILEFDSWHHTGKHAMRTDFYALPEKMIIIERAKNRISTRKKKFWNYLERL